MSILLSVIECIQLVNKYLVNISYIPATILGQDTSMDTELTEAEKSPDLMKLKGILQKWCTFFSESGIKMVTRMSASPAETPVEVPVGGCTQ